MQYWYLEKTDPKAVQEVGAGVSATTVVTKVVARRRNWVEEYGEDLSVRHDGPSVLQAGVWTSGTDGFDRASVFLGLKGLVVDLADKSWANSSNGSQWKQAYDINRRLNASSFLKANGIKIPKTSVIKAAMPGVLNGAGKALGVASGLLTVGQVIYNGEIKASNVLDATMTAASFIPGVGWIIGGGYFLIDLGVRQVTEKSIGEHLDAAVGNGGSLYKF